MKKTMSADELRAHALAMGGEAVIGGKRFNTARAVVKPITAAPPPRAAAPTLPSPPITAPAAPQSFSRAQAEQMLGEQEDRFTQRLQSILASIQPPEDDLRATRFTPKFDREGQISVVGVEWQKLARDLRATRFTPKFDREGQISVVGVEWQRLQ